MLPFHFLLCLLLCCACRRWVGATIHVCKLQQEDKLLEAFRVGETELLWAVEGDGGRLGLGKRASGVLPSALQPPLQWEERQRRCCCIVSLPLTMCLPASTCDLLARVYMSACACLSLFCSL